MDCIFCFQPCSLLSDKRHTFKCKNHKKVSVRYSLGLINDNILYYDLMAKWYKARFIIESNKFILYYRSKPILHLSYLPDMIPENMINKVKLLVTFS